jgi:hypothetical protein
MRESKRYQAAHESERQTPPSEPMCERPIIPQPKIINLVPQYLPSVGEKLLRGAAPLKRRFIFSTVRMIAWNRTPSTKKEK